MYAEQGGVCKICATDSPAPRSHFSIDHCHETGRVRGLLCLRCNNNLGWLENVSVGRVLAYLNNEIR